jgi:hypothetical protein
VYAAGNSVRPILALAALVAVANRALSATEIKQLYKPLIAACIRQCRAVRMKEPRRQIGAISFAEVGGSFMRAPQRSRRVFREDVIAGLDGFVTGIAIVH